MSGRNDTERDNGVIGLERAAVSMEIDEFSNAEIGLKRQTVGSNGGGSAPHTLVEITEPSEGRDLNRGAFLVKSGGTEVIPGNVGRAHWLSEKNLLEASAVEEGDNALEVRFGPEYDSGSVNHVPASVSEHREVSGDCSGKGGTIFESEIFRENNSERSVLVDSVDSPQRFVEDRSSVEIPDSTHNIVQEDVFLEDDPIKGNLETGMNLNKTSSQFYGEIMHSRAETCSSKKSQCVKSEAELHRDHTLTDEYQESDLPEQNNGFYLIDPDTDRGKFGKEVSEEFLSAKEAEYDWEFTSRVQPQEGSCSTSEIFNQKSLNLNDGLKKVGENSQSSEMKRAALESNTEIFKNMNQRFPRNKESNNFYEDDTDEDNVYLSSQTFQHGDMVWGKVKSHPWWPGHVFNEAFATASVKRTRRDGHILVAFFGDSSYGWFSPSELIPFEPNFAEKSRQSSSRNFLKAVEEALDEASRWRAVGVACCCRNPRTFRPAAVEGYFAVDVVDYEPGGVYSEQQVKAARESFQPVQFLSFVKKMALMPRSSEQRTIEGLQSVATILAYRRAVFVEFDETYPQAFGVDPVRPPQPTRTFDERVPRAPLSGPLVIAEALSERNGASKLGKPKTSKKDKYLFKRRAEPNDHKPSVKENIASQVSDKQIQNSHSFVFQQRLQSPKEKEHTVPRKEQQRQRASVEKVHASADPFQFHTVQASVGSVATNVPDKKMPGVKKSVSVGSSHKLKPEKQLLNSGGQKAPKPKNLNGEKKPALVKQQLDPFSSAIGQVPVDPPDRKWVEEDNQGLASSIVKKENENSLLEATPTPTMHSLGMLEKSAAESASACRDAYQREGGYKMTETWASVVPVFPPESKTSQAHAAHKKAKSLKRSPIQSLDNSNPDAAGMNDVQGKGKIKKRKVTLSTIGDQSNMQTPVEVHRDVVPEVATTINSVSADTLQSEYTQRKDDMVGRDSVHVDPMKSESGCTEQVNLRQLVGDLLILALDPFHGVERNGPANAQRAFLRFRSVVYQKSLVLPSAGDASVEGTTWSETSDHKPLVRKTADDSDGESPMVWRKAQSSKANLTVKPGIKRSLSENSHDVPLKRLKKQQDAKVAFTDRKPSEKPSEGSQAERKELISRTANPNKLDPGRKPPTPAPEAPEPTLINIKFPPGSALPSEPQLKARFARFGPLDLSGTRIFYRSGTCRVVFKFKSDAQAAYIHATHNQLFCPGVRYTLKVVDPVAKAPEQDSAKRWPDVGRAPGQAAPFRPRGERPGELRSSPASSLSRRVPAVAVGTMQLKSCLKKQAADDAGGNGVAKEAPRVKFMLGVEDDSGGGRGVDPSIGGGASGADGAPSVIAMDVNFNAKMVRLPLPTPLPPPPLPFPREFPQSLLFNQIVEEKAATIDISHQLLGLLLKCNDIVSNVKCALGYVPYHPL